MALTNRRTTPDIAPMSAARRILVWSLLLLASFALHLLLTREAGRGLELTAGSARERATDRAIELAVIAPEERPELRFDPPLELEPPLMLLAASAA
ncbi:MAG: hypothetical protein WAR81_13745, partial [Pseudomonadales bacterium]